MADIVELSSFVNRFMNLWKSGRNATLYDDTKAGKAFFNLNREIGQEVQQNPGY